jgi:TolA-binding protein
MKFLSKKNFILSLLCSVFLNSFVFSSEMADASFIQGCQAYSRGDWTSAIFMFRKVAAYPEYENPDLYYMLITAELYANDYESALMNCDLFLNKYDSSIYFPRICYTKGKILYNLGQYEKSIVVLSDFCHQYPDDDLYPSALFLIAESLYADYDFEKAEDIYKRIIEEFPSSNKVSVAQFRIESIAQRSREEKLLYLLKQTGEEYLAAKEEYEKQLKLYNSDAINSTRDKLIDLQKRNKNLEEQIKDLEMQINQLKQEKSLPVVEKQIIENEVKTIREQNNEELRILKEKALLIQELLNKQQ